MASSITPPTSHLLADEYTNGDSFIDPETEKAQENKSDGIVTDAITTSSETKLSGKGKKSKGKKNKDFDLDFDVADELAKMEQEATEVKSKPKTYKQIRQNTNKSETEDIPADVAPQVTPHVAPHVAPDVTADAITDETSVKSKGQKKKDKKSKKKQTNVLEDGDQALNEEAKEDTEPPQDLELASKKKGKKGQKGPSSGMREQIRRALKEQEEADKFQREEEERKAREFEMKEEERLARLEKERIRKEKKKSQRKDRIAEQKQAGTYLTKEQKEKIKERQDKAVAMQQAYGMTVGPDRGDEEAVKVNYGGRKRNRNKEVSEDNRDPSAEDEDDYVVVKEESQLELEPVRDSWEDILLEQTSKHKQTIKENWEDTDSSDSSDSDESPFEAIAEQSETTTTTTTTTTGEKSIGNGGEQQTGTNSVSEDSSSSDTEASSYEVARERILKRRSKAERDRTKEKLRSPILCVLGHVDTGKTKILDKIRHTSVQDGEAGGITQQIGATFIPSDTIRTQTSCLKEFSQKTEILLPGLLIIDTPGHESFRNLRSRGSSLCDIAILVVDIMHGLEPQTIESLNLLKKKKCKFIIALNKVDRIYDWRRNPHTSVKDNLKKQRKNTTDHFNERLVDVKLQLNTQGLNVALFWEKFNFDEYIPMVPTSAITGDGMADLMAMMVLMCQKFLIDRLMWSREVEATVMEVKVTPGYGYTLDVVFKNGVLKEGDTIVLFGTGGPIVTQARAILTPQPLKEMRVKGEFIYHQLIDNSQGIKIAGKDLENAIASSPILVPARPDEVPVLVDQISAEMKAALTDFRLKDKGVYVQASTLGSMEALLEFLKSSKIPYSGINIGPVYRKDVIRCSTMLEHDPQYAVILAFDVRIDKDAQELSDQLGIKIFTADIIYHLFDNFTAHRKEYALKMKEENRHLAVYPVRLSIVPNCVFNTRDPLVMGVRVEEGVLVSGTPIHVPDKQVDIGIVTSLEINHKPVEKARKGVEVCVKIETPPGEAPKMFDRHFGYEDELVSKISRESIDTMKRYFKEELVREDWELTVALKKTFGIF